MKEERIKRASGLSSFPALGSFGVPAWFLPLPISAAYHDQ